MKIWRSAHGYASAAACKVGNNIVFFVLRPSLLFQRPCSVCFLAGRLATDFIPSFASFESLLRSITCLFLFIMDSSSPCVSFSPSSPLLPPLLVPLTIF